MPKNWPISYPREKRTVGQCGKVYQEYFPQSSAGGSVTTNTVGWTRYALAKDPTFGVSCFFSLGVRACGVCVVHCYVVCILIFRTAKNPESKTKLDKTTVTDAVPPSLPHVHNLTLCSSFLPSFPPSTFPTPPLLLRSFPFQRSLPLASTVVQTPTYWNVSSTGQATLDPRNAAS